MDFSKLNQEKNKIFILLVVAFLFLISFLAFDSFLTKHILIYLIWLLFFFPIMIFSGVIYGFLTKSRSRAIILGIAFPLMFYISKSVFDSYYTISTEITTDYDVISSTTVLTFGAYPLFIILNAIACWFASTSVGDEGEKKVYYFITEKKEDKKVYYFISLICMAFVVYFMADLFYSIIHFLFFWKIKIKDTNPLFIYAPEDTNKRKPKHPFVSNQWNRDALFLKLMGRFLGKNAFPPLN